MRSPNYGRNVQSSAMLRFRFACAAALLIFTFPIAAAAQDPVPPLPQPPQPLPKPPMTVFVVDARGTWAALKQEQSVASALVIDVNQLPSRGLGFIFGAHVYPLRLRSFAIGVGAEWLRVRGSNTVEAIAENAEDGPVVKTRWNHLSPQASVNFGGRDGWSYLTVGLGRSTLTTEREDLPQEDAESGARTLNYGGGARWFVNTHVAFTFDLRWYSVNAQAAAEGRIAMPKTRMRVLSAGISIR